MYRTIKSDLFNIAARLKEIDKDYFVLYSYRDSRYEVHSRGNKGNTFCFACDKLDARTLTTARRTRCERMHELMRELDEYNETQTKMHKRQTIKNIERGAETVLSKVK